MTMTLELYNTTCGRNVDTSREVYRKKVRARIREGAHWPDVQSVLAHKWAEWGGDAKMQKYFAPDTLFGEKFWKYLDEAKAPAATPAPAAETAEAEWDRFMLDLIWPKKQSVIDGEVLNGK